MSNESKTELLRIGVDGRELLPDGYTGTGRYLANFIEAKTTLDSGHHFVIFGLPNTRFPIPRDCFTFRVVDEPRTLKWDQMAIVRALKQDRIDLFFTPYDKTPLRAPCPVVMTIHDVLYQYVSDLGGIKKTIYNALYRLQRGAMARRASRVLTVSEYSRKDIANLYAIDPEQITVTYNAVSDRFTPDLPKEQITEVHKKYGIQAPYVLNLSNFKPHKNPSTLIEAFARLPVQVHQNVSLVIAGARNTFLGPLRTQVHTLGLDDAVVFPGAIPEEDLPALYAGATLFTFPSFYEGFGLPPLEAMACGVPVVSSNATSLPEVVADAGLMVDPSDVGALSHAIERLLTKPDLRQQCIEKGIERARLFSLENVAGRILTALEQTVRSHI